MSRIPPALLALAVTLGLTAEGRAAEFSVYAAGSLPAPLTEIAEQYERASGNRASLTFGASGLLRDRIGGGERVDVFASANMEHPQSLVPPGGRRVSSGSRETACAC